MGLEENIRKFCEECDKDETDTSSPATGSVLFPPRLPEPCKTCEFFDPDNENYACCVCDVAENQ